MQQDSYKKGSSWDIGQEINQIIHYKFPSIGAKHQYQYPFGFMVNIISRYMDNIKWTKLSMMYRLNGRGKIYWPKKKHQKMEFCLEIK